MAKNSKLLNDVRADCDRFNKHYELVGPVSSYGDQLFYSGALAAKKVANTSCIQIEQKEANNNYKIILEITYE